MKIDIFKSGLKAGIVVIVTGIITTQIQGQNSLSQFVYFPADTIQEESSGFDEGHPAAGIRDTVFIYTQEGITAGWGDGSFFLSSPDGEHKLTIGGRVQTRYEYSNRPAAENLSSFYMRRVRLNFRGEFFDGRVTWRVMPEISRTASLRDGWIDYAVTPKLGLRAGQFIVPFQWLRFVSSSRQHFLERGSASEDWFGAPGGYDIGVGLHGRNEANTFAYGIGVFDGSGRNTRLSNSVGNMVSGRMTWAALGVLPIEESDLAYLEEINLTLGTGLQAANKNEVRGWSLGQSPSGYDRADWVTGTADIALHWKGLSLISTGYFRKVTPDDPVVDSYKSIGQVLSTGVFVVPKRLELVGRYSSILLDLNDDTTRQTDWGAGMNIYHIGHNLKTLINYERLGQEILGTEHIMRVQLHMQF